MVGASRQLGGDSEKKEDPTSNSSGMGKLSFLSQAGLNMVPTG